MNMKIKLLLLALLFGTALQAQDSIPAAVTNPANDQCLSCHGKRWYTYANQDSSQVMRLKMFKDLIIDTVAFYHNNHRELTCTDCHSSEYSTLPHNSDLKLEPKLNCTDCHSDSDDVPPINFTGITEEYEKSIHATKTESGVNCWSCHNPHTYNITTRSDDNLSHVVAYDNSICLECHSGMGKFDILYGDPQSTLIAKHKWLPKPVEHFKSVRCIECHAEIREDLLVAHNIRPKAEAIRDCAECHSANSRLKHSLYKYQLAQERTESGILSALISNQSFAIGTNPSPLLNLISLIILAMAVGGIAIHTIIRIIKK
jgi:5-methylcytosine-specific restriction endonuclease McrA